MTKKTSLTSGKLIEAVRKLDYIKSKKIASFYQMKLEDGFGDDGEIGLIFQILGGKINPK